ncbi:MAG: tRNA-dihydrouridine synthase, partial [Candidatus Anstonellaceae archaeon]
LNFGCPASRVVKAGAGSALLKKPEKIGEIVRACVSASSLPITTKIRSGWDSDKAPMIARIIEDAGAVGITVHWRTACEGRKRNIGWESVSEVKRSVGIPVIGNGGAYSPELAVRFLKEAQCDAVMISSAALGNPAIFTQSNLLLEGKPTFQYSWKEKKADFLEYFSLAKKHGCFSLKRLKAHAAQFFSGKPGAKKARVALAAAKTEEDVLQILHKL